VPFSRIDLLSGKSPEYLRAVSESVNDALVLLGSPPEDNFQIITQHDSGGLVFDRHFRVADGGERSDDFLVVTVSAALEHDEEGCEAFYRRLVDLLGERPGVRPEDVFIMLHSAPLWYFSFANGVPLRLGRPSAPPDQQAPEHEGASTWVPHG
jgi:hypothetical protein